MQYKPVYTTSSLLAERKHETQRFFFFSFFLTVPEFIILLLNYVEGLSSMSLGKDSFFISDTPPFYLKSCSFMNVWPQILQSRIHFRAIDVYSPNTRLTSPKNKLYVSRLFWYHDPVNVTREWMCKSVIPQGNANEDVSYKHLAAIGLTNPNMAKVVKTEDLFVAALQCLVFRVIFTKS